jgi:UDP-3-O-[3-hydroxymyristoyl] glucosamine N-acyltransferase
MPLDGRITDIAPLDRARSSDITFLDNAKYLDALATTRAGACLLAPRFAGRAPHGLVELVTAEPYRAFVAVARALFPSALRPSSLFGLSGRSADARVHASARIEAGVTIDPLAVIGPNAEIGSGTLIAAGAVIGPGVAIGRDCAIGAGATVVHALIGDRVIIHPGARIGQDGFGYLPSPRGHRISRKPGESSFRTMWRSVPTPRSIAARPATPSSARERRSTILCRSRTT